MDLKLLKMLCKDSKQHHVIFHELYSVSSLLCIAQNVRFEIPYKVLYFETPFLMIFKYYAWASYGICGVCRRMQDEQENVCCQKRTCVTSYVMFNTTCLDREVLHLAIRADYSTQSYRKAAYRQHTLWKCVKLGRGNRKILPSCVVTTIRQAYPAPDGNYMGFRRS